MLLAPSNHQTYTMSTMAIFCGISLYGNKRKNVNNSFEHLTNNIYWRTPISFKKLSFFTKVGLCPHDNFNKGPPPASMNLLNERMASTSWFADYCIYILYLIKRPQLKTRLGDDHGFTKTDFEASRWLRRQVPRRYSGSSSGVLACKIHLITLRLGVWINKITKRGTITENLV